MRIPERLNKSIKGVNGLNKEDVVIKLLNYYLILNCKNNFSNIINKDVDVKETLFFLKILIFLYVYVL